MTNIISTGAPKEDARRLVGQNADIFKMLSDGPCSNVDLADRSLKYTSRISDIRRWLGENGGGSITCKRSGGGLTLYTMRRPR